MLIPDEFLTDKINATNDYKEYEMVFVRVDVPMNQSQPVVSTYGMHRSTPKAHRTPTLTTASPQGKKRKQSVGESRSLQKSLKITIRQKQVDKGDKYEQSYNDVDYSHYRLEPVSHKENLELVDDDDDEEKVNEKKDDEMGSLETRTEEMQTPIPATPRSPRTILSSDKNITQELTDTVSLPTSTISKDPHSKRRISNNFKEVLANANLHVVVMVFRELVSYLLTLTNSIILTLTFLHSLRTASVCAESISSDSEGLLEDDSLNINMIVLGVEKKLNVLEQPMTPVPAPNAPDKGLEACNAQYDRHNDVACLMLNSVSPKLQRQFENYSPYDMLQELESINDLAGFVRNYNMRNMGKTIGALHTMLIEYEKGLPKKAATP
ncbi:hypothetical protein Tco_0862049 [Tanacetum coccineum]